MALATILRRSARQAIPLASRAISSQASHHHHHTRTTATVISAFKRTAAISPHFLRSATSRRLFCSNVDSSDNSSSDAKLLDVIQSEISVVEESDDFDKVIEAPSGFPFKIEDNVGEEIVTLTREYDGETITVEVSMPNLVTGEEDEVDNDEEESGSASNIPLVVTVAKKTGPSLEFDCTAHPDEISINSLSLRNPDTEDELAYEGPDFLDLDENLQKAFHKYLEIRGIKPSTTNFLHEYMIEKDNKEYLRWLKDVKKFVEA